MTVHTRPHAALLDALAARVGHAHVLAEAGAMEGHLVESARALSRDGARRGASGRHGRGRLRRARMRRAAGCRSCRRAATPASSAAACLIGGIVLSLARLDRIREVDPVNATMTVEAGCILQNVQDGGGRGRPACSRSPCASEGSCRIGGNLATNAGGTAVLRYGNTRELVLGLEVVLADGRVWNGLQGLRKDNTGYDLKTPLHRRRGHARHHHRRRAEALPASRKRGRPPSSAALPPDRALQALRAPAQARGRRAHRLRVHAALRPRDGAEARARRGAAARREPRVLRARRALLAAARTRTCRASLEAVLGRGDRGRARRGRDDRRERGAEPGALAPARGASPRCRASRAARSSTTSRCRSRASPSSSKRPRAACEAAMPGIRVCAFGHFGDGNIHFNLSPAGRHGQGGVPRRMGALQPHRPRHRARHERLDLRRARHRPHQAGRARASTRTRSRST